jgi:hypothetical protein
LQEIGNAEDQVCKWKEPRGMNCYISNPSMWLGGTTTNTGYMNIIDYSSRRRRKELIVLCDANAYTSCGEALPPIQQIKP